MVGDLQAVCGAIADEFFITSDLADVTAEIFRAEDLLQRDAVEVALAAAALDQGSLQR